MVSIIQIFLNIFHICFIYVDLLRGPHHIYFACWINIFKLYKVYMVYTKPTHQNLSEEVEIKKERAKKMKTKFDRRSEAPHNYKFFEGRSLRLGEVIMPIISVKMVKNERKNGTLPSLYLFIYFCIPFRPKVNIYPIFNLFKQNAQHWNNNKIKYII